jgi:hypothetical protein
MEIHGSTMRESVDSTSLAAGFFKKNRRARGGFFKSGLFDA